MIHCRSHNQTPLGPHRWFLIIHSKQHNPGCYKHSDNNNNSINKILLLMNAALVIMRERCRITAEGSCLKEEGLWLKETSKGKESMILVVVNELKPNIQLQRGSNFMTGKLCPSDWSSQAVFGRGTTRRVAKSTKSSDNKLSPLLIIY